MKNFRLMFKKYNTFKPLAFALISLFGYHIATAQTTPAKFIDPANMDLSVRPGDDFYNYASGTWLKNNPVPAKETRWGSFNELRDFNINAVKKILENAVADKTAADGSLTKRVADFYTAGMDSAAIEKRGVSPIMPYLQKINAISNSSIVNCTSITDFTCLPITNNTRQDNCSQSSSKCTVNK